MRKKLLIGIPLTLVLIVGVLAIVVAAQPAEFHIARSATMAAPPAAVFGEVNDLHRWDAWSPWAKLDPAAKNSFEGPATGTGAIFRWSGNSDVGVGSLTITESRPHELIRMRLDFVEPFADTSDVEFKFEPAGEQTRVTWSMAGHNGFVGKAICLFLMDMEKMVGGKYEEGLANLKAIVETAPDGDDAAKNDSPAET